MPCSWKEDDFVNTSILPNVVCKLNKTPTGILMSHDKLLLKCIRSSKKMLKEIKVEELSILNMNIYYNTMIIKRI